MNAARVSGFPRDAGGILPGDLGRSRLPGFRVLRGSLHGEDPGGLRPVNGRDRLAGFGDGREPAGQGGIGTEEYAMGSGRQAEADGEKRSLTLRQAVLWDPLTAAM